MTPFRIAVIVVILAIAGLAGYYFWPFTQPPVLPPSPPVSAPPAPPPAAPAPESPQNPIPQPAEPAPQPLPTVQQSDPAMRDAIGGLIGKDAFERYFVPERIVHRIVATIDNLPRKSYAQRLSPVKPPPGLFQVTGKDDDLAIAPSNAERYSPYVRVLDAIDTGKLVSVYMHFYPLFQKAYVDLGYPNGYFNDRLVEVIDNLLAAPDVKGPVKLVVPHVLYEYADPDLQQRSAGQKLLIRMGPANAAKVKAKLREIRAKVARARP
ncbi:MAG TPA: DUF3014 domain-containing protein [Usitatibacter sp.]